jgi:iron complex transport system ATP-binding protein
MSIHAIASHNVSVALDGRWLLRDINVALRAACLTVFIGPNGSGKTTLLRVLAGLLAPSEGHVTLHGTSMRGLGRRALSQRIAFVPQDTHVNFAFTVRETVEMGRHPHLRRFERLCQQDHAIVEEAMRRADVLHLAHRAVTALSGGERQRVIIARSLATQAEVLLLDEPTANLDIAHALDVLDLCQQLAHEGKTIGLALHDINAAARYATHVILMSAGHIVQQGRLEEVLQEAQLNHVFDVCTARTHATNGQPVFVFSRKRHEGQQHA